MIKAKNILKSPFRVYKTKDVTNRSNKNML